MNGQRRYDSQKREVNAQRRKGQAAWIIALLIGLAIALQPGMDLASGIDTYPGDSSIFSSGQPQPNVLILLDTSGSMENTIPTSSPYAPATTYAITKQCKAGSDTNCYSNTVYQCTKGSAATSCTKWTALVTNVSSVKTTCPAPADNPYAALTTTGQWNSTAHTLNSAGTCSSGSGLYALGNWINWWQVSNNGTAKKSDIARQVVTNLVNSTKGVRFGVMVFAPIGGEGGGLMKSTSGISNGYVASVKDMDAIFSGSTTNRQALIDAVNKQVFDGATPNAETLFEAMRYFQGGKTAFPGGALDPYVPSPEIGHPTYTGNGNITYTSPIQADCQKNYVIIITDGQPYRDNHPILRSICNKGDCDGDGHEVFPNFDPAKTYMQQGVIDKTGTDYLDDVAWYLYHNDLSTAFPGKQNVIVHTIGFGLVGASDVTDPVSAVKLLQETAAKGGGLSALASNAQELSQVLTQALGQIFEGNTSFLAPVVPLSPDNKSYSGSRVYLGFFKPQAGAFWYGNLKKYGIDSTGAVVDKNGDPATNSDGSFLDTAISYWSTTADGGNVDKGGVGEGLLKRDFTADPRDIYTFIGNKVKLTRPKDAFRTSNNKITPALLNVSTQADRDKLIDFVHGRDAYDADADGNTTEKRGWVLGDILHSRPQVVSYSSYTFTPTAEADCNVNKTLIFVGGNDGMLHVFRDCDGSETWAFIPDVLLPNLQYLTKATHTYFVDSSPSVYIYDANKDGNIVKADGDKVILIFGMRRGGGSYYALDVSDPAKPLYLWDLSSTESPSGVNTDYAELGQSWSEPVIAKVKIGSTAKVVAIIGAGYDNANEDGRYGATQTFNGAGTTSGNGEGAVTSSGTSAPLNPKGRGLYVVEVATLDSSGAPSFNTDGSKVWGYTNANNSGLTFSIPSAATVIDRNSNGYADRVYVGDTGGNTWRFDIGNTSTSNWTGRKIFSSNPGSGGSADVGRKIFYKPSVILESGYEMMFFGTGDREHPLNKAVVDRLYGTKDKSEVMVIVVEDSVDNLHELVDVTTNDLQGASTTSSQITTILSDLNTKYGWYIRLNQTTGEKVLAPALAFNEVYYSTYAPPLPSADPCSPASQLTARVYIVSYKTGEAVNNLNTSNDSTSTTNMRAKNAAGDILMASDRVMTLGSGIPSGVVLAISAAGDVTALIGCGGSLCAPPAPPTPNTIPIYWKMLL